MEDRSNAKAVTSESLWQVGRSVRTLAIAVILILSAGVWLMVYSELQKSGPLGEMIQSPGAWLSGFVLLMLLTIVMLLTIGYLIGKGWSASRYQRQLVEQLLEEGAISRAQRLDPLTGFHHPEVCREILLHQASYARRLHTPLSLLELTIPEVRTLSLNPQTQPLADALIRQVKQLCRPIDSLLRWSPESFLMVFPELTAQELPGVTNRIQTQLEKWLEQHVGEERAAVQARAITTENPGISGDILLEVQGLLETGDRTSGSPATPQPGWRREKSVGLALEAQVQGIDQAGNPFQESIVTERVASDRVWFPLKARLSEKASLTITFREGGIQETAVVARLVPRGEERLVEAQFSKTPENWVVRA